MVSINNPKTWDELKISLYRNFADTRNETCLIRNLVSLKQLNDEEPKIFFEQILHILNLLCSHVDLHETSDIGKSIKRE